MWMNRAGKELLSRPASGELSPKRSTPEPLTITRSAPVTSRSSFSISAGWIAATSAASRKFFTALVWRVSMKPSRSRSGAVAQLRASSISTVRGSRSSTSLEWSLA